MAHIGYIKKGIPCIHHLRHRLQAEPFAIYMGESSLATRQGWLPITLEKRNQSSEYVGISFPHFKESQWIERKILLAHEIWSRLVVQIDPFGSIQYVLTTDIDCPILTESSSFILHEKVHCRDYLAQCSGI